MHHILVKTAKVEVIIVGAHALNIAALVAFSMLALLWRWYIL